jgi:hypothetical protein
MVPIVISTEARKLESSKARGRKDRRVAPRYYSEGAAEASARKVQRCESL